MIILYRANVNVFVFFSFLFFISLFMYLFFVEKKKSCHVAAARKKSRQLMVSNNPDPKQY